jgi:hypothetical protein
MNKPARIGLESIVVRTENLLTSELDGETVMIGPTQPAYYGLDATAQRIWELIAEPRRVSDLCAQLMGEYAVERVTCEREVCAFLSELSKEGLVRSVAKAGG